MGITKSAPLGIQRQQVVFLWLIVSRRNTGIDVPDHLATKLYAFTKLITNSNDARNAT